MKVLCSPINLAWVLNTLSAERSGGEEFVTPFVLPSKKIRSENPAPLPSGCFTLDPVQPPSPYRHQNRMMRVPCSRSPPSAYLPASEGSLLALITASPLVHPSQRHYHPPTHQDTKARNLGPSLTPFFHHFAPPSKPSAPPACYASDITPSPATSFLSCTTITWEAARAFLLVSLLLPSIHFLQRSQRHSLKK